MIKIPAMPELAEVEYFRKQWDCRLGDKIISVELHRKKRIFRGIDVRRLVRLLKGSRLLSSHARGKQMLFRFEGDVWLGLHLGMTGKLSVAEARFEPGKHDHLVLRQKNHALVFNDMRVFGRILFHVGAAPPGWWSNLPPDLDSKSFTLEGMRQFLDRHRKLPIKAALLLQAGFPGVGNWMADEILWRSKLHPRTPSSQFDARQSARLWLQVRDVCRKALKKIGHDFSDPPRGWLFHERWKRNGLCPVHKKALAKGRIGGRTAVWCPKCQPERGS
jgi:formamidopyrimidine-DNA glycosylase